MNHFKREVYIMLFAGFGLGVVAVIVVMLFSFLLGLFCLLG